MRRRRERAERSRERTYAWNWVYEFVEGDGEAFDYGYDFVECATEKFYRALGAEEFLPFYCFLDFPMCELGGLGLSRTMTLGEGHERCDFRFKEGGKAELAWPPPFLKRDACERQSQGGFSDPQVARLESEVAGRTVEGVGSGGIARLGSVKCQNNEISSEPGWQSSPVASIQLLEKKSDIK